MNMKNGFEESQVSKFCSTHSPCNALSSILNFAGADYQCTLSLTAPTVYKNYWDDMRQGHAVQIAFYCTTGITIGIAIMILLGIVRYAQKKKLLFIIPSGNSF